MCLPFRKSKKVSEDDAPPSRTSSLPLSELRLTLETKKTMWQQRGAFDKAIATRSINSRHSRQPVRTHYSSKVNPLPLLPKNTEEDIPLTKQTSSASSNKSSLFRTATNSTFRRARAASSVTAKSSRAIWYKGLIGALEKNYTDYNPHPKPQDWCTFVFKGNPWIEDENDPEYKVPLPVRRADFSRMKYAGDFSDETLPAPTPLHEDPEIAMERQQSVNKLFMGRFAEPDIEERPVSPLSDPMYDGVVEDAPRHTTMALELECDEEAHQKLPLLLARSPFVKEQTRPCQLCEYKAAEAAIITLEQKEAEKEAKEHKFDNVLRRKRAGTTISKVDKMETILSRHPSQTNLTDTTNDIEMGSLPPKVGRPKALTTVDHAVFHAALEVNTFGGVNNVGIGPSSVNHIRVTKQEEQVNANSSDRGSLQTQPSSNAELAPSTTHDRRRPCQQLPTLDSLPPSRQLTPEPGIRIHKLLNLDNASTVALKSRPISVMEQVLDGSSPTDSTESAEHGHAVPEVTTEEYKTAENTDRKEKRSSGSEEDVDATAEGTSAWGTKARETRGTTPESEEDAEVEGLVLISGERTKSKVEVFDPSVLEERLRGVELQ